MNLCYHVTMAEEQLIAARPGLIAGAVKAVAPESASDAFRLLGLAVAGLAGTYAAAKVGRFGYRLVRRYIFKPKPMILAPVPTAPEIGEAVIPESPLAGSMEYPLTPPRCQVVVGFAEADKFYVAGCAVRIGEWLLIPDHVKSAVLGHPITLRGENGVMLTPKLAEEDLTLVDTDLYAVRLKQGEYSQLGLAAANVAPALPEQLGAYASIVGAYGKGSTGTLKHSVLFGKVDYFGSTFKGYSGAAYMHGSQLVGIHLHGGSRNSGYSASYVLCMLKYLHKIKDEDTADWLELVKTKKARIRYEGSWGLEDVKLRINGRYHIVGRDQLRKTWGEAWEDQFSSKEPENWRDECRHCDPECSGEVMRQASGASPASTKSGPNQDEAVVCLPKAEWTQYKAWRRFQENAAKKRSEEPAKST